VFTSFALLVFMFGNVLYMHSYLNGGLVLLLGVFLTIFSMSCWFRDVIREATFEGHHTQAVQLGLRYGMVLFIISEIFFFIAFF